MGSHVPSAPLESTNVHTLSVVASSDTNRNHRNGNFPAGGLLCDLNGSPLFSLQVLASILYKAAREGGYVQPSKVQQILGLTQEEVALPETASEVTSGFGPQEVSTNESESDIPGKILRAIAQQILTLGLQLCNKFIYLSFSVSLFKF